MSKKKLMFVDDDANWLSTIEILFSEEYDLYLLETPAKVRGVLSQVDIDLAILDLNLEGHAESGIEVHDYIRRHHSHVPVIFLSADTSTRRVRDAALLEKVGFVVKDGNFEHELAATIQRGLVVSTENNIEKEDNVLFKTKSPVVKKLLADVERIANSVSDSPILIFGESGTGKEHLAKYIAAKAGKRIVTTNIATIAPDRAVSELFGHMRGAYTGATSDRVGLVQAANNGMFFMDEIGECSLDVQSQLLRVIQEKEIVPLGSNFPKKVNVQFIAATHQNLDRMIEDKQFRLDLYQRLSTFTFRIPPLRDRPEDIVFFTNIFLEELRRNKQIEIKASAYDALLGYDWPGNVRELRNIVERLVVKNIGTVIDKNSIYSEIPAEVPPTAQNLKPEVGHSQRIMEALELFEGNRSQAARHLGVSLRTLQRWLKSCDFGNLIPSRPGRPTSYQERSS